MSVISTDGTLVPCPFDPHHKVSERRLKFHTIACASRRLGEFDTCKYNAAHFVPLGELEKHYTSCADFMAAIQHVKKTVVKDKQEEKKKEAVVMVEKQRQQGPAMMKPLISFGDEEDILSTAIPPPPHLPTPPPPPAEAQNRTFADGSDYFDDNFDYSEHSRASRNFISRASNYSKFTKSSQRSISNSSSSNSTTTTSNTSNGHHHFENSPINPPSSPPSPPPQLPGAFAMPVTVVHPKFNVLTPVDWSRLSRKETFEPLTKFQVQTMTKGQRQRYHTLLIDWQKWKNRQAAAANNGQ